MFGKIKSFLISVSKDKIQDQKGAKEAQDSSPQQAENRSEDIVSSSVPNNSEFIKYDLNNISRLLNQGFTNRELVDLYSNLFPGQEKPNSDKKKLSSSLLKRIKDLNLYRTFLIEAEKINQEKFIKYQPYYSFEKSSPVICHENKTQSPKQTTEPDKADNSIDHNDQDILSTNEKLPSLEDFKQKDAQRRQWKQTRKEIISSYQELVGADNIDVEEIKGFLLKFKTDLAIVKDVCQQNKSIHDFLKDVINELLRENLDLQDESYLLERITNARDRWIDKQIPSLIPIRIPISEKGPQYSIVNKEYLKSIIDKDLGKPVPKLEIDLDFHVIDAEGQKAIFLIFSDNTKLAKTINIFLQKPELSKEDQVLLEFAPIDIPYGEVIASYLELALKRVTTLRRVDWYKSMSSILITAYRLGYWLMPSIQQALIDWRLKKERIQLSKKYFAINRISGTSSTELSPEDVNPLVIRDNMIEKVFGKMAFFSENVPNSPIIKDFQQASNEIIDSLYASEDYPGDLPLELNNLHNVLKQEKKANEDVSSKWLSFAKYYADSNIESLFRYCMIRYCKIRGQFLLTNGSAREARKYFQIFLHLICPISKTSDSDLVREFYEVINQYFESYEINLKLKIDEHDSKSIMNQFIETLLDVSSSVKDVRHFGQCILELAVLDYEYISDVILQIKEQSRKEPGRNAIKVIVDSLIKQDVFRQDPYTALLMLDKIKSIYVSSALKINNWGDSIDNRYMLTSFVRFVLSPNISSDHIFSTSIPDSIQADLVVPLITEPCISILPKQETDKTKDFEKAKTSEITKRANLIASILGLEQGIETTEYFSAKTEFIITEFNRLSIIPDLGEKQGIFHEINKVADGWIEDPGSTSTKVILEIASRIKKCIKAENAKLIHDTELKIKLMTDQTLHSPYKTRLVFEISNVGKGEARGIEFKLEPDDRVYLVDDKYLVQKIDHLRHDEKQQIELLIKPLVKSGQTIKLKTKLCYNTLRRKDIVTSLDVGNQSVKLYSESDFKRYPQIYDISEPASELFFGRREELEKIADNLHGSKRHDTHVIVYGIKRAGKTSIVQRFLKQTMEERGFDKCYIPIYKDLQANKDEISLQSDGKFLESLIKVILQSLPKKISDQLNINIKEYSNDFNNESYVTFRLLMDGILDAITPMRILMILDEFSSLYTRLEGTNKQNEHLSTELFSAISNFTQQQDQLTFIFTGTYDLMRMMKVYAEDIAKVSNPLKISFLDSPTARQLIAEPVSEIGLNIDPRVVDKILNITNCHPYLIQYTCLKLIEELNSNSARQANLFDLDKVINEIITQNIHDQIFSPMWNEFGIPGQKLLSVIATKNNNKDWANINEIIDEYIKQGDNSSENSIHNLGDTLQAADLLERQDNSFRITVPLYQLWVQKRKPCPIVFSVT